jgi:outer membrane protein OmpA-like peptidoglycan-associated protein
MTSKVRFISLAIAGAFVASALTGCTSSAPQACGDLLKADALDTAKQNEVALVIAPTKNFVEFSSLIESSIPSVQTSMGDKGSRLSIVLADGNPGISTYTDVDGNQPSVDVENDQAYAIKRAEDVYDCAVGDPTVKADSSVVVDPELDLIKSLRVAADSFDAANPKSVKRIVVLSNALQTTTPLAMQTEGIPPLNAVSGVVAQLRAGGGLPDLKGATVDFIGLGHVYKTSLNQQSVDSLQAFWTGIVEASNGHIGVIQREAQDTAPVEKSIPVSAVKALPDPCISAVVTEDDGARFTPDTANFVDQTAATSSAKKIAAQLAKKADCKGTLTVTGYVASGTNKADYKFGNSGDASLSKARARAFASLLTAAGVKTSITVIGGGKGPFSDWDKSGKYVESLGKKNRIVSVSQ